MSPDTEAPSPYQGLIVTWANFIIVAGSAVAGAIIALLALLVLGAPFTVNALVNGGPGATPSKPLDLSGDQLDRYVDTELIYIDTLSTAMNTAVSAATGISDPSPVTALQDGETNVIKFTSVADTADAAAKAANAAATVYVEDWKQRNKSNESVQSRFVQQASSDDATPTIKRSTAALLGFVLGAGIGVVIVWIRVVRMRRERDAGAELVGVA